MREWVATAAAAFAVLGLSAADALAGGGYVNVCRGLNGQISLDDGELVLGAGYEGAEASFVVTHQTVIRHRRGECVAEGAPTQRFGWEFTSSVATVELTIDGESFTMEMLCEEASDGVPAAYTCAEDVILEEGGLHLE